MKYLLGLSFLTAMVGGVLYVAWKQAGHLLWKEVRNHANTW